MTFLGYEVGETVITGENLNESDFLRQVLLDFGASNGRNSWDPMLVLAAIEGDEDKAGYSAVQGRAEVNPITGENRFIVSKDGKHKYLIKKFDDNYYKKKIDMEIL